MALKIVRRKMRSVEDEEWMKNIVIEEVGRLVHYRIPRGFVLPCVTIEATVQEEEAFLHAARKELGVWHSWWNFHLGASAKRRAFRDRDPEEHLLLVSGVLVLDGTIAQFSIYERDYRRRSILSSNSGEP